MPPITTTVTDTLYSPEGVPLTNGTLVVSTTNSRRSTWTGKAGSPKETSARRRFW